jgi:alanine racemase
MTNFEPSLRLHIDGEALVSNWRALDAHSGAARAGAAVKANGYGLGAREVVTRLRDAGCRDFFVAHWGEAESIADLVPPDWISVLNGITQADIAAARALGAIPVLNTPEQVTNWRNAGGGRCHVMLDSGINRLGLGPDQAGLLADLDIDILLSHLSSADEDVAQNADQLGTFAEARSHISAQRYSLANSAGIVLGAEYHHDLTRPGLSLYGGIARPEMADWIKPVVHLSARLLQVRELPAGAMVGYNATHVCREDTRMGTISLGYADGYLRAFSGKGRAWVDGNELPVIGRVSMDLVTLDLNAASALREGDWVNIEYDLVTAAALTGLSQYELLTGLGTRFAHIWR